MKKFINLIAFAALLFAPAMAWAQAELTVGNGTATDEYIPVYGYYVDAAQHNQVIYPADSLQEMTGGTISGLTFYMSETSTSWSGPVDWNTTVTISLGATEATSLSGVITGADLTQVAQVVWNGQDETLVVEFDNAFTYEGGNLLLDITTTAGSYGQASFYGAALSGASVCTHGMSTHAQDFLPKTTFSYVAGSGSICYKPRNLVFSERTSDGFTVSWTQPNGGGTEYAIFIDGEYETSVTDTFYNVTGLSANTLYSVQVKNVCDDGDSSSALSGSYRTDCAEGSCELTIACNDFPSAYYGGGISLSIVMNGSVVMNGINGNTTVSVCSGDSLYLIQNGANTTSWYSPTVTVTDVAGIEQVNANLSNTADGDTIWSTGNACPTCMPTDAVAVSDITSDGATFSWGENGATLWALYLDGELIENANPWSETTYSINGLEANTQYTFGVRVLCDDEDTSAMRSVTFRTACAGGSCELTVSCNDFPYSYSGDGMSVSLMMNGSAVLDKISGTSTVEICDGDSLYLIQNGANSDSWNSPTVTVIDVAGVEVINASLSNTAAGDTIWAAATGCPSCIPPNGLYISAADVDYLQASWNPIENAEGYLVYFDSVLVTESPITDTFYMFDNLEQMSQHQIWVRAYCGDEDTSAYRRLRASTPCSTIHIDTENEFNINWANYVYSRQNDPNWTIRPQSHDDYSCWYFSAPCVQPRGDADAADNGIWFLSPIDGCGNGTLQNSYFCLPIFDAPINTLEMSFYAKVGLWGSNDAPDKVILGIADISGENVEWLDTLNGLGRGTAELYDHIRFEDYEGTGVRFAIKLMNYTNWNAFISFKVKQIPDCSEPMNIVGHNFLNADSTYFTWTTTGASEWQVQVLTDDDPVGDLSIGATTVSEPTYVLPHLNMGQHYTLWVRTSCGGGLYSEWVHKGFYAGTVVMPATGADTVSGCGLVIYDNGYEGSYISGSTSTIVVRPATAGDLVAVVGGWFTTPTENGGTLTIYDGEGTTGEQLLNSSSSITALDTIYSELGALTIVVNAGSWAGAGCEIYTACVEAPTCLRPRHVTVSDITGTTATVTWDSGNATADTVNGHYNVYVKNLTTEETTTYEAIDVTYVFDEGALEPETNYELWVVGVCSDDDQSLSSEHVSFRTGCANGECVFTVEAPYSSYYGSVQVWQNGDMIADITGSEEVHSCLGNAVTLTWAAGSYSYDGFSVYQGDSTLISISDPSGMADGDTIVVFDGQCNATVYDIAVPYTGDCEAPYDLSVEKTSTTATVSFTGYGYAEGYEAEIVEGTWNGSMGNAEAVSGGSSHSFSGLTAATQYTIAVRTVCDSELGEYSDWTTVSFTTEAAGAEGCTAPTNVAVPEVGIDSTSAVVTWQENGGASKWQLHVSGTGYDRMFEATGNASYILNNLTPSTNYTVAVRSICSAVDTSEWSQSVSFRTTGGSGSQEGIETADALGASIYPNPASHTVTIEVAEPAEVNMVDQSGRVCGSWHVDSSVSIDVTSMARGVYYVRMVGENGMAVRKLIVK